MKGGGHGLGAIAGPLAEALGDGGGGGRRSMVFWDNVDHVGTPPLGAEKFLGVPCVVSSPWDDPPS